jgi:hypothetical protein
MYSPLAMRDGLDTYCTSVSGRAGLVGCLFPAKLTGIAVRNVRKTEETNSRDMISPGDYQEEDSVYLPGTLAVEPVGCQFQPLTGGVTPVSGHWRASQ